MELLGYIGVIVSMVSLVFTVLAMSLVQWGTKTYPGGNQKLTVGVWKYCLETSGDTTCDDMEDVMEGDDITKLRTMKVMLFLAIFCLVATAASALVKLLIMKEQKIISFVSGALAVLAGVCLIVSFAIYKVDLREDDWDYGAAFALDIAAWLLAWASGGLIIAGQLLQKP